MAQEVAPGKPAPAFAALKMVAGAPIAKLAPGKVHLVDFFGDDASAGHDRARAFARLQKEHGAKLAITGVVCASEEFDRALLIAAYGADGAHVDFPIVFDEGHALHDAWVKAAGEEPPAAFVVDAGGTLAWCGGVGYAAIVLPKVLAGNAEPQALKAETDAAQRQFTKVLLTAQWKPQNAAGELDALLAKWPVVAGFALPATYDTLLHGDGDSREWARRLQPRLCDALIANEDAAALNALAWSIVDPDEDLQKRDLATAERAAAKAVQLTQEQDPAVLDTLARVFCWRKDYKQAVAVQQKALALSTTADEREAYGKTLAEYQALAGKM